MTSETLFDNKDQMRLPTEAPAQLGKYEIRGELGRGTCGVVYKGYDPFVQRYVAVKVAQADAVRTSEATNPHRAFFAEARAAGMLHHPHIVSLYDAGVEDIYSYLVMEYIDGETLAPMCNKKRARPPTEQVIDIIFKCAKGLDYSHEKGVLHRDIKPGNIMLTREGVPKIMDFSIAAINAEPMEEEGIVGSPLYMPPEQVRREELGPRSDLYSLGAVMYQLLTGEAPFPHTEANKLFAAILSEPAPRLDKVRPEIPKALADIVDTLLRKDPDERYPSGKRLAAALSQQFDKLRYAENQISRRESGDALRRLHFFHSFSETEIDELLNASTMCTFNPSDTIMAEGEIDNAFYIIVLGSAEVRKGDRRLQALEKGDCFGEIGMLRTLKRSTSVIAGT
ncbi:MAG TPA: serine/threonine-protein kinase, partial [Candidatus Binatia bacterium]|nr:serine/threonine-protein kinase [Candidatus Binatia bacterium]